MISCSWLCIYVSNDAEETEVTYFSKHGDDHNFFQKRKHPFFGEKNNRFLVKQEKVLNWVGVWGMWGDGVSVRTVECGISSHLRLSSV